MGNSLNKVKKGHNESWQLAIALGLTGRFSERSPLCCWQNRDSVRVSALGAWAQLP
ncbi:MAG: hypothetical protein HC890_17845 [Chloroflexaceae bacterium]|nr:hypothetical protein [Chloroflexaceae bacterium]